MQETDIAYAAGVMDGEGCILIARKRAKGSDGFEYYRVEVKVGNSDRLMLLFLQDLFGGSIFPVRKQKDYHKQQWCWDITGKGAINALSLLLPYLITKKAEAELAITFWRDNELTKYKHLTLDEKEKLNEIRDAYYVEMCGLKHAPHLFRQPPKVADMCTGGLQ